MFVSVFSPLFAWIVCLSGIEPNELLVYFGINPWSFVSFAIIFSNSEGWLIIIVMISQTRRKFKYLS